MQVPDTYTRRARIYPLLIVALPVGVTTLAFFPEGFPSWKALWSLVTWCGGVSLLAQLGRDRGKQKEGRLFREMGGAPTTRLLRYRDASNPVILSHRHRLLSVLFPDLSLPDKNEETADPAAADRVYEACIQLIRGVTRDSKRFPLIFEENCNYGFRRNLWGMKPIGATVAIIGVIVTFVVGYLNGKVIAPSVITSATINTLLVVIWLFCISPQWVRVPAETYAERLLESIDHLTQSESV